MPGTRKLSRTTSHRNAMLNNLVSSLILNGKIETTLARAKEVKPLADSLIDLAIKEKDNYEVKEKTVSRAKLDKNGKKVKETKTSKNGNKYEVIVREVVKEEIKVDKPSKLAARRKMFKTLNKMNDFNGNTVDLTEKLFNEIAPKYEAKGGYTRLVKLVARKGDGAEMAIIELI
ncbi:MAG: bL17 family ribosomal protein [Clostridia bacterium]|nr:bL17 family ribosomal protein [Clostridia bacterium]